tara:strand:- start:201 stop:416 length:216 start_codon:yes stop_codon:yes gene_type:complete
MRNTYPSYDGYDAIVDRLSGDIKGEISTLDVHDTIKAGMVEIVNRLRDNLKTEIEEIISGRMEEADLEQEV